MPRSRPGGSSSTQDDLDHHTSPREGPQPTHKYPGGGGQDEGRSGSVYNPKLPDHVTKHPNPVGRPRKPRY